MTTPEGKRQLLNDASDAAQKGDAVQVARLLRTGRSPGYGLAQPLLKNTTLSTVLLDSLSETDNARPIQCLRSLLLVSSIYETPWRAIELHLSCLHSKLGNHQNNTFAGLAHIKAFLQDTISTWFRQDICNVQQNASYHQGRTTTGETPHDWLLRIVERTVEPLTQVDTTTNTSDANDNRHWSVPLEIIVSILSLCRELEGDSSPICKSVIQIVFGSAVAQAIHADRFLPWFKLASDVRMHLLDDDWDRIETSFMNNLELIPASSLPGVERTIISVPRWKHLLLHVVGAAAANHSIYATVETVLQSSLASLSYQELCDWFSVSPRPPNLPQWVLANFFLSLLWAARQSGSEMASRLFLQATGKRGKQRDILQLCSQALPKLCPHAMDNIETLQTICSDLKYEGEGRFTFKKQELKEFKLDILCRAIFVGSLSLPERSRRLDAAERSQGWVHLAQCLLPTRPVSTLLIVALIFKEVPSSQSSLVRMLLQCNDDMEDVSYMILSVIVRSSSEADADTLSPIFSRIATSAMSFDLFRHLADAFCGTESGRSAIWTYCQKNLRSGDEMWMQTMRHHHGSNNNNNDTMLSALYGVCTLAHAEDSQALKILSDLIVSNKPAISSASRKWLFNLIEEFVAQDKFTESTRNQLLRSLLIRLLDYFHWSENVLTFGTLQSQKDVYLGELADLIRLSTTFAMGSVVDRECERIYRRFELAVLNPADGPIVVKVDASDTTLLVHQTMAAYLTAIYLYVDSTAYTRKSKGVTIEGHTDSTSLKRALVSADPMLGVDHEYHCASYSLQGASCGGDLVGAERSVTLLCDCLCNFIAKGETKIKSRNSQVALLCVALIQDLKEPAVDGELSSDDGSLTIVPAVFQMFAQVVPTILSADDSVMEAKDVEVILTSLQVVCGAACNLRLDGVNGVLLLKVVAKLYFQIGGEETSKQLIRYLEGVRCSDEGASLEGMQLSSAEDIDAYVQKIRSELLASFVSAVRRISTSDLVQATRMKTIVSNHAHFGRDEHGAFFVSSIILLVEDLSTGLTGLSAGITETMFGLYVEILSSMTIKCSALYASDKETKPDCVRGLTESTLKLFSLLYQHPLVSAPLFNKTLVLASVSLPALFRLFSPLAKDPSADKFAEISAAALDICLARSVSDINLPWTLSNADNQFEMETEQEDAPSDKDGIPLSIAIPIDKKEIGVMQLFRSESHWKYTLSTLMVSLGAIFDESLTLLNMTDNVTVKLKTSAPPDGTGATDLDSHIASLGTYWAAIVNLLKRQDDDEEERMLAEALPLHCKVQFSSVLVKVCALITKALRLLHNKTSFASEFLSVLVLTVSHGEAFVRGASKWVQAQQLCDEVTITKKMVKLASHLTSLEQAVLKCTRVAIVWSKAKKSSIPAQQYRSLQATLRSSLGKYSNTKLTKLELYFPILSRAFQETRLGLTSLTARSDQNYSKGNRRKRPAPRSRNNVVDQWLHLDNEVENGDDKDDAYADLEDFLVGG